MFDSHFPYIKLTAQPRNDNGISRIEHVYTFTGRKNKGYIASVEQYNYSVYIIKFCLREKKRHLHRYNLLSGLYECPSVIGTIGNIIKIHYSKDPFASFGFVGSPLPNEKGNNTKRFSLYSKVVAEKISAVNFSHYQSEKISGYLLVNKDNPEPDLPIKVCEMFNTYYALDLSM